jgi:hypothetical protein
MKLKNALNTVTRTFGRQILKGQKASPTLLFAAGITGVVVTAVLASRATLKLYEVLDEANDTMKNIEVAEKHPDYSVEDARKDRVIVHVQTGLKIARLYAPAILVGALSVAALTGSHVILNRRNAGLTAAYALLDKGFREYRARVVNELGAEKDQQFRYDLKDREIVEETKNGPVVKTVKDVVGAGGRSVYARCFEKGMSENWDPRPGHNQTFLQSTQVWANQRLQYQGHLFLNEVYDMLGLDRTSAGAVVGWVRGNPQGDDYIDFGVLQQNADNVARFLRGDEQSVWLDFNVDGVVYDKI